MEVVELKYPVSEDEARDFLRITNAGDRYEGDSGKAALDADLGGVMQALAERGQWLNSLDPLQRMEAQQQPILSGVRYVAPEAEAKAATAPAEAPAETPTTTEPAPAVATEPPPAAVTDGTEGTGSGELPAL